MKKQKKKTFGFQNKKKGNTTSVSDKQMKERVAEARLQGDVSRTEHCVPAGCRFYQG